MSGHLTSWNADAYLPAELQRLQQALARLHDQCYPSTSSSVSSRGRGGSESQEPPGVSFGEERENGTGGNLIPARERASLRRMLARVERLAGNVEVEIAGGRVPSGGWKCPRCHRFQRDTADFCDRCSPQVPRPQSRYDTG